MKSDKIWRIKNAGTIYSFTSKKLPLQGLSQVKVVAELMFGIWTTIAFQINLKI